MKHEIDNINNFRTDLAIDNLNKKLSKKNINIIKINVSKSLSRIINKKSGNYLTIEFKDISDVDNRVKLTNILTRELKKIIKSFNLLGKKCLVIGLGNVNVTPDSLGPRVVKKIITTAYLKDLDKNFANVAAYSVGVKGETGFESIDIVKALVRIFRPDFILVIDALVSKKLERLNRTIQITDTGINPGSGIGNSRNEISEKTLHVKTLAIGVPTVVDLKSLIDLDSNMIVTAREIDFLLENLSEVIANSINCALHKKIDFKRHF